LSYGEYLGAQEELFGHVVPQFCNWVELLQWTSLEMVVWVAEWGRIFEMDVDGVVFGQEFGAALVEEEAMVAVQQVV